MRQILVRLLREVRSAFHLNTVKGRVHILHSAIKLALVSKYCIEQMTEADRMIRDTVIIKEGSLNTYLLRSLV